MICIYNTIYSHVYVLWVKKILSKKIQTLVPQNKLPRTHIKYLLGPGTIVEGGLNTIVT